MSLYLKVFKNVCLVFVNEVMDGFLMVSEVG